MYVTELSGILQHGIFGPLGFTLRFCGQNSDATTQIVKMNDILSSSQMIIGWVGLAIWLFLTLKKQSSVPRWTAFLCPILTFWLMFPMSYVPAPLGFPLVGGWSNIRFAIFMAVLALTYNDSTGIQDFQGEHKKVNAPTNFL
jgi:hypothetical protein